jgi:asparagine synthase (glutamine-hydrolysing)
MCGIAGYIGNNTIEPVIIQNTLSNLNCRGPEGSSDKKISLSECNVNLMFTRLAIIDVNDRSMQPIKFRDFTIILNGEIYNYKDLKSSIEIKHGTQNWSTAGDVEVALRYLVLNGIESAKDFDGMFAFVLIDSKNEIAYFGRDFFGEKPLYLLQQNNEIYFGSEPKAIFTLVERKPRINENHVSNFVVNGYKYLFKTNEDFFHDLIRVEPGTIRKFELRQNFSSKTISFLSLDQIDAKSNTGKSRSDILSKVRKLVVESVGKKLESDVPLAICLSGGVDSALIAAIAKNDFGVSLNAYTLVSKDARYSEEESSSLVAKYLGLNHTLVKIDKDDFLNRMHEIISYHESPISTSSYYVQNFLMNKIRSDGFKVSLMGTGADEIFTGYYDHHLLYLATVEKLAPEVFINSLSNWNSKIKHLVRSSTFRNPNLYILDPNYRDHIYEGSKLMSKLLISNQPKKFSEEFYSKSLMKNRMMNELFHEVIPVILHEDDRNSMMFSIENRSPYLSFKLLSEVVSIEDKHFIDNGLTKSLLRESFDGYLPKEILYSAKKIGFNASVLELCDLKSSEFKEFLDEKSVFWDLFHKDKVLEFFNNMGSEDFFNKTAFNLISSKIFCDIFG